MSSAFCRGPSIVLSGPSGIRSSDRSGRVSRTKKLVSP